VWCGWQWNGRECRSAGCFSMSKHPNLSCNRLAVLDDDRVAYSQTALGLGHHLGRPRGKTCLSSPSSFSKPVLLFPSLSSRPVISFSLGLGGGCVRWPCLAKSLAVSFCPRTHVFVCVASRAEVCVASWPVGLLCIRRHTSPLMLYAAHLTYLLPSPPHTVEA